MTSGKTWLLMGTLALLLALAAACSSGGSSGDEPEDGEPVPTPVLVPSEETTGFLGETIAFDFPSNWFIVRNEYDEEAGKETVVVSNVDRDVAPEKLPEGGIRFQFTAQDAQPTGELEGEVVEQFALNGVTFTVRSGDEIPWSVFGRFTIGGVYYGYRADVQMNIAELDTEPIKPILQSWVVGSTNHHPQRKCISPLKCPD